MALDNSLKLIAHALASFKKVIEADTDVSTIDLGLLENLNTNQFLNYIKLEQDITNIETESERADLLQAEFNSLLEDLAQIEKQAETLDRIGQEALVMLDLLEEKQGIK